MIAPRPIQVIVLAAAMLVAAAAVRPARADFFDDMRRTFTSDIPHFFQDDIPCAFGGRPTSHTRTSCKSGHGDKPAPSKPAVQRPAGATTEKPPASAQPSER